MLLNDSFEVGKNSSEVLYTNLNKEDKVETYRRFCKSLTQSMNDTTLVDENIILEPSSFYAME